MQRASGARRKSSRRSVSAGGLVELHRDLSNQLAAIVQNSNDAIFSRRFDGIVTTWNAAAERMFGYAADEIIGKSSAALLPRGQKDEFRKLLARIRSGEVVQHFETQRLRKDGRRIHVSLTLSPVRDALYQPMGFSTIARDITGERRMLDLLARREHELQVLFDGASVGLVLLSRRGKILHANKAFVELLGRPSQQVLGRPLRKFCLDPTFLEMVLARLLARQTSQNLQTEFLARDGQTRPVLIDANALWEEKRFVHACCYVRDISQRKQLERELLETSEREQQGFAHELHDGLGQQLGGIAYLSNVLREKLRERAAPEAGEAAHIFTLVRDAIEQTRRISRRLSPIPPEPAGLMSALRELSAQTASLFRIRCVLACARPVLIEDAFLAGHLYRIAQEAVNNARKHAKPSRIRIRLGRTRNQVILAVADDGKGIASLSPRRQGLGLHIMQYRAGLVRGQVKIQPRRGGGTVVICAAPWPATLTLRGSN